MILLSCALTASRKTMYDAAETKALMYSALDLTQIVSEASRSNRAPDGIADGRCSICWAGDLGLDLDARLLVLEQAAGLQESPPLRGGRADG